MLKALLVEDNPVYRGMLNELLAARFPELQISEASGKDQALRFFGSVAPDLVFMDIRLSECNGLDLTRMIKSAHPETIVVVMSSYDLPEYRNAFERFGADHFVAKNDPLEVLFDLVESILAALRAS